MHHISYRQYIDYAILSHLHVFRKQLYWAALWSLTFFQTLWTENMQSFFLTQFCLTAAEAEYQVRRILNGETSECCFFRTFLHKLMQTYTATDICFALSI